MIQRILILELISVWYCQIYLFQEVVRQAYSFMAILIEQFLPYQIQSYIQITLKLVLNHTQFSFYFIHKLTSQRLLIITNMKNTLFIERPKIHHQKSFLVRKQKKQINLKTSHNQEDRIFTTQSNSNLDDFFDRFHQNFVVLQKISIRKNIKSNVKKPLDLKPINKKIIQIHSVKKINKKDSIEVYLSNQQTKLTKVKRTKSTLHKNNKTCQSESNILLNVHKNKIELKKKSQRKTEAQSKRNSSLKISKKGTNTKNTSAIGSTATTTLGNSAIKLKQDVHIASYLRIKIKSN